ncbi:MAG: Ankyrin repeat (many copies) [Rickettsiaceae bacterium]|jgi:hypothetical protein|nr:Ankyrin repeat (many copies) [Rickettsiaceae bacterium]
MYFEIENYSLTIDAKYKSRIKYSDSSSDRLMKLIYQDENLLEIEELLKKSENYKHKNINAAIFRLKAIKSYDSGEILEKVSLHGLTLLSVACHFHSKKIIKYLLEKGANPNIRSLEEKLPIEYCLLTTGVRDKCESLEVLLDYNLEIGKSIMAPKIENSLAYFTSTSNDFIERLKIGNLFLGNNLINLDSIYLINEIFSETYKVFKEIKYTNSYNLFFDNSLIVTDWMPTYIHGLNKTKQYIEESYEAWLKACIKYDLGDSKQPCFEDKYCPTEKNTELIITLGETIENLDIMASSIYTTLKPIGDSTEIYSCNII